MIIMIIIPLVWNELELQRKVHDVTGNLFHINLLCSIHFHYNIYDLNVNDAIEISFTQSYCAFTQYSL